MSTYKFTPGLKFIAAIYILFLTSTFDHFLSTRLISEQQDHEDINMPGSKAALREEIRKLRLEVSNLRDLNAKLTNIQEIPTYSTHGSLSDKLEMQDIIIENQRSTIARNKDECRASIQNIQSQCHSRKCPVSTEASETIQHLRHNLGECEIEWGACEQIGMQKDVIITKQSQDISKRTDNFKLCNRKLRELKKKLKNQ